MSFSTILLDLDDTLLENSTELFIPAYLNSISHYLSEFAPAETITALILKSTQAMQANSNPNVTNYQAFYSAFLSNLNCSYEDVNPKVQEYYEEVYPTLRQYTNPTPIARQLVAHLIEQGYQVVIATNPLFPHTAVEQRLAWAGVQDFPYALVITMEIMHYSKPDPQYYREILTRVGASPAHTLMVGDDPQNDIAPANAIGIKTWWITDASSSPSTPSTSNYKGTLTEFYRCAIEGGC